MKTLLSVTAILEAVTGLALLAVPSRVVAVLLGASLDSPGGQLVAQIAGAALLSLALACWWSRHGDGAPTMLRTMILYNGVVAALLVYGNLILALSGIGLWPAVFAHVGLGSWCVAAYRKKYSS
ncbi:MAG TPA: hypothetical protein VIU12_11280 [Chryseolinea sp.]